MAVLGIAGAARTTRTGAYDKNRDAAVPPMFRVRARTRSREIELLDCPSARQLT
jgi:hypothetical protein